VIGLYEGSFLRCRDGAFELLGNKAAVMRKGQDIITHEAGVILNDELTAA